MEKYKRPSKAKITALALTMVAVSGGTYGMMNTADEANAQTLEEVTFSSNWRHKTKHFVKRESTETPLTGDLAIQVTNAAQATFPGGTVAKVKAETDDDGSVYEALVTTADGVHMEITFDENFNEISREEKNFNKGEFGRFGHDRDDDNEETED